MKLKVNAILDKDYTPMVLVAREFAEKAKNGKEIGIAIERNNGLISVYKTKIYAENDENYKFIERLFKTILWIKGGYKVWIGGSDFIASRLKEDYSPNGKRKFDYEFMSGVYENVFTIISCALSELPAENEKSEPIGGHLDGCRIGFDAGGSDRKVSAVVDGKDVFSVETVWHPKTKTDPQYHFDGILESFKAAAEKMPRVDAIGVSTAGVCIDNRLMVSSLFVKVPKDVFAKEVRGLYIRAAKELGENIPIVIANDGDITALTGAMNLDASNVLGIAMGTSEAGGFVDDHRNVTGWLNELAFVPVDYNLDNSLPIVDEWSGDEGCGVRYFSQECVIKLAPAAGIEIDDSLTPGEKLKVVQKLMSEGDERAKKIYETIGVYLGYTVAYYAMFYKIKHLLILGRVTSGDGGTIIINKANEVMKVEFPELADTIKISIPDEINRRVGQSIAAASLPKIK